MEDTEKLIAFKSDKELDKVIGFRALLKGIKKAEMYNLILTEYFDNHPLSEKEKELFRK